MEHTPKTKEQKDRDVELICQLLCEKSYGVTDGVGVLASVISHLVDCIEEHDVRVAFIDEIHRLMLDVEKFNTDLANDENQDTDKT